MRTNRQGSAESDEEADYTEEQVLAVKRAENANDFYSVLGVNKDFNPADLKKSYRRLALLLHPDKNHAPGAGEAFKKVSKAFATLNDAEKRAKYDKYGEDESAAQGPDEEEVWAHFERAFGSNVTPDEVFNLFYGKHAKTQDPFQPSAAATFFYRCPGDSSLLVDIQRLLPLVLLLFLSILCSVFGDWYHRTTWSAAADTTYSIRRETVSTEFNVVYFVAESFQSDYPSVERIKLLETEVEKTVLGNLKSTCARETAAKERRIAAAKRAYFSDPYEIYNLKNQRVKSCDEVAALKRNTVRVDPVVERQGEKETDGSTERLVDEPLPPEQPNAEESEVVSEANEMEGLVEADAGEEEQDVHMEPPF